MQKKTNQVLLGIALYFAAHGVLYFVSPILKDIFGIWSTLATFLFGNVTVASMPFVPQILGIAYVVIAVCLLFGVQWGRIGVMLLSMQAIFFEFPIGTIIGIGIIVFLFLPSASKSFSRKMKKTAYRASGLIVIVIGLVAVLISSNITTGLVRFTSYRFGTFSESTATPASKIASIDQRIGPIDVLLELTDSPDNALKQQDLVLDDIAPYVQKVLSRLSEVSNSLIVTVDASDLAKIAENQYIDMITPVRPSFQFLPYQPSGGVPTSDYVPIQLAADALRSNGITGKGITIAIMDTGIKENQPDLQRNGKSIVVGGLHLHGEYVYEHGTMVASCIANQNKTFEGIAPDVNLLNVEVFSWQTVGGVQYLTATNADILQGFEFVANWKKMTGDYVILSCSWGVSAAAFPHDADLAISAANRLATEYNIPVIAAAGNSGPGNRAEYTSIPYQVMSPAGGKNVLSVGAVDSSNTIASFSSRGPYYDGLDKPDVVAPGVNVPVLDYNSITTASGTSFACPYVSAVAALIAQNHKDLSSDQLYGILKDGATDLGPQGFDYEYGSGIVDAQNSVSLVEQTVTPSSLILFFIILTIIGAGIFIYPYVNKKTR